MLRLSKKWMDFLLTQPETGMGYQVVSVLLHDGRRFDRVPIVDSAIRRIKGREDIPFTEADIKEIIVTHDKWDFSKE